MANQQDQTATRSELESLLKNVARAHHQAFLDTDGVDPDWPMWYAERLHEPLRKALDVETTISEIVYLLVKLSKEHPEQGPEIDWERYYSSALLDYFLD